MRISILHIVVAALFAIVYISGGIVACTEVACAYCLDESACCSSSDNDDCDSRTDHHQDNDHDAENQHSDNHHACCSCSCHIACIEPTIYTPIVVEYDVVVYPTCSFHCTLSFPLMTDHIALA